MNKFFKYIICCLLLLPTVSCLQEEMDVVRNESIVLTFDSGAVTKAADTDAEAFVAHVDVIIFSADESKVHHERVSNNGTQTFTLQAERSRFTANTGYYVYLVANSSCDASVYAGLENIDALKSLVQTDSGIMFTGLANSPQHFLMDAVAYTADAEPSSPETVVLNDGVASNSTMLKAVFRRAAAKVFITIKKGTDVVFADADNSATAAYFMRNCPYQTTVIDGYDINSDLETPDHMPQNTNFVWGTDQVTVTAYGYEHNWKDQSVNDKATTMVVNVPFTYKGAFYTNNWYKIPVSQESSLERNHYYSVTVTVNAPGAENKENPQIVDNVTYEVLPWEDVTISVGDGSNHPQYLQLNINHVDMYNVNSDNSTLKFASSSVIPADGIELLEAYYYNYLDERVDLQNHSKYNVFSQIKATAESGVLNGGVTINSPFVAKTNEEIQALIAQLGPVPTVDEEPVAPESPEKIKPNPQAIVDKYNQGMNNNSRGRIAYSGENENVKFYASSKNPNNTAKRNVTAAQKEYDDAWNDYSSWGKLTQEEKDAVLAKYQADLNDYNEKKQVYDVQVAALQNYNDNVQSIYKSSQNTHSNAIRYLRFRVTNSTGQTAEFTVNQYPTIYITNDRGYYSYRSDFGGTTYLQKGNPNYSGANWDSRNNNWNLGEGSSGEYFFGSKVALGSEGNYTINYTYWDDGEREVDNINSLNNPRMYHVHVTATSANYIVSKPRLDDNNFTESSADNTKLVSPSFMIASQLGATLTPGGGIEQARSHCEKYIEVTAKDYDGDGQPETYDDWRLPTAAEIDIIIQHQDASDAMAVVLTGSAYYCAYNTDNRGQVIYTKSTGKSGSQTAVRCVRDAY